VAFLSFPREKKEKKKKQDSRSPIGSRTSFAGMTKKEEEKNGFPLTGEWTKKTQKNVQYSVLWSI